MGQRTQDATSAESCFRFSITPRQFCVCHAEQTGQDLSPSLTCWISNKTGNARGWELGPSKRRPQGSDRDLRGAFAARGWRRGPGLGCTGLTLEVRVANDAAKAMYHRFGYAPAGVRKNYYSETNEDALVMWAHDADLAPYGERLDAIEATLPGRVVIEEAPILQ